jgi:hypothetical protein
LVPDTRRNGKGVAMLGDAEQSRLAAIETTLRVDDPLFVRRFDRQWRAPRRWRLLALLAVPGTVLTTVLGLALGNVVAAVAGVLATGAAAGLWFSHRATSGRPTRRRWPFLN